MSETTFTTARGARPSAGGEDRKAEVASLRTVVRAVVASVLRASYEHPDVEDCTHETLRRAIENGSRLREGEPLRPWVLGIARHVALDARRGQRRSRAGDDEPSSVLDRAVDPAPLPDERASQRERVEVLARALEGLAQGPREALVLFHAEGLGYEAIAARLNVPMGTVATWITRGRRAIAEAMAEVSSP